jgi:hypothetical protein
LGAAIASFDDFAAVDCATEASIKLSPEHLGEVADRRGRININAYSSPKRMSVAKLNNSSPGRHSACWREGFVGKAFGPKSKGSWVLRN